MGQIIALNNSFIFYVSVYITYISIDKYLN